MQQQEIQVELSEIQPSLDKAQKSLENLDKKELDKVRQLLNPNETIKFAMTGVMLLTYSKIMPWAEILTQMKKLDFK